MYFCCMLCSACCALCAACCALYAAYCALCAAYCAPCSALHAACCALHAVLCCCMPCSVCCTLCYVCCMLYYVCCMVCSVCCELCSVCCTVVLHSLHNSYAPPLLSGQQGVARGPRGGGGNGEQHSLAGCSRHCRVATKCSSFPWPYCAAGCSKCLPVRNHGFKPN